MKKALSCLLLVAVSTGLVACKDDAAVASQNMAKAADNFQVNRRTVFYNGYNGEYILSLEGYCSIKKDNVDNQLEVICLTGKNQYKKHFLGLSDNVTYFSEQLDANQVSAYHHKVIFKPQSIIPDVELKLSNEP